MLTDDERRRVLDASPGYVRQALVRALLDAYPAGVWTFNLRLIVQTVRSREIINDRDSLRLAVIHARPGLRAVGFTISKSGPRGGLEYRLERIVE